MIDAQKENKFELDVSGKKIEFNIKGWADKANGEAIARCGDTEVLAITVMNSNEKEILDFFPLTVNYEEKFYASRKILGSRYLRRESRPSDNAVIISRLIDRTIRPVFPKNFKSKTQVVATCLSWDEKNDPDVLGLLASSLALCLSDIPWNGPIGAVRIIEKQDKLVINPSYEQREGARLDIVFAGRKDNKNVIVNMIEAKADEASEELILRAFNLAIPEIKKLIEFQEEIQKKLGKEKIPCPVQKNTEVEREIGNFLGNKVEEILFGKSNILSLQAKLKKITDLKRDLVDSLEKDYPSELGFIKDLFEKQINNIVHKQAIENENRIDGRKLDELREIHCQVSSVPRTHGSGFFSRGSTKSLSVLTLAGPGEQQVIEGMEVRGKKRFLHHYNFPPYSCGEVRSLRAPCRREIGHGMLAEKALLPLIPDMKDFPYTIRIVSEMLSSNGSTSMASVCSSCLALMDAGVPIQSPIAGIAIGLMKNKDKYKLLTDIQGPEDFHGDMDFKVAGTRKGINAIQMDVKAAGIDENILKQALERAKQARLKIIDLIEKTIPEPRSQISPFAPKIFELYVSPDKIGNVIGAKGKTIKGIIEKTGADIDIEDSGAIFITSESKESAEIAIKMIEDITREAEVGEVFSGKVVRVLRFGVIVELFPGQKGLLPSSQTPKQLRIGDKIKVRVCSIDNMGRVNLEAKDNQKT